MPIGLGADRSPASVGRYSPRQGQLYWANVSTAEEGLPPRKGLRASELLLARLKQHAAELARVPALLGRVAPSILQARLSGRESWIHALYHQAERRPQAPALRFQNQRVTFRELARRVNRTAAALEGEGLRAGEAMGLVGTNSIDYVVVLLAAARLGVPVAMISPELDGALLKRSLRVAGCVNVLSVRGAVQRLPSELHALAIEYDAPSFAALVDRAAEEPRAPLPKGGELDFAYVYTSGTTGRSKPCRITHRRAFLAATAFGRMVHELKPSDVIYCPLPLYHASPLLLGLGACLLTGSTLALRSRFSAREFLSDVCRYEATVLLYVGELGRALGALPREPNEKQHRLRLAVGNGLSESAWRTLESRFGIRHVREFYAASEFPGAIVNLTGTIGSLGHVPFERLRGYRLVRVDPGSGEILRDARGLGMAPVADEPGELVLRLRAERARPHGDYLGYVGEGVSGERITRDLFEKGDLYCRSGDVLRRDRAGRYFFVDRLGDTFRFKGENVSTREVEEALVGMEGVRALLVVGVRVPGVDGRPGLLVAEAANGLDLETLALRCRQLPAYARPCFVRVVSELRMTESLKPKKRSYAEDGVDPQIVGDSVYYRSGDRYLPFGASDFEKLRNGSLRF